MPKSKTKNNQGRIIIVLLVAILSVQIYLGFKASPEQADNLKTSVLESQTPEGEEAQIPPPVKLPENILGNWHKTSGDTDWRSIEIFESGLFITQGEDRPHTNGRLELNQDQSIIKMLTGSPDLDEEFEILDQDDNFITLSGPKGQVLLEKI